MNTPTNQEIKQVMDEIKANQQTLMTIAKKHLELYAQQIARSDELSNQTFLLQKRNIETQRIAIISAFVVIVGIIIYSLLH